MKKAGPPSAKRVEGRQENWPLVGRFFRRGHWRFAAPRRPLRQNRWCGFNPRNFRCADPPQCVGAIVELARRRTPLIRYSRLMIQATAAFGIGDEEPGTICSISSAVRGAKRASSAEDKFERVRGHPRRLRQRGARERQWQSEGSTAAD